MKQEEFRFPADHKIGELLEKRKAEGLFRSLRSQSSLIDFCSNDYLGFARNSIPPKTSNLKLSTGSTGSRLLSGNSPLAESLEQRIADFHRAPAGLIFNSGYDANLGLFSSIAGRGDTLIYDSLVHASVRDGIRLSAANAFRFAHNDLMDLEKKLKAGKGNVFVAVESLYSMDGDTAPLKEISKLCRSHGASLVVDEAHATGVCGKTGEGLVASLGLEKEVFARLHTFGKALGCHGAIVLGNNLLRDLLINYARSFIYTTALPPVALQSVADAYDRLEANPGLINELQGKVDLFRKVAGEYKIKGLLNAEGPIQGVLVQGNAAAKETASGLQQEGLDVRPILSPTVPAGLERLRICIHVFNADADLLKLTRLLKKASE